ncbi:MAG TPA: hypothetical protein VFC44_22530 [Candidatus Saccharimonadales bacterium]|nr:hypothetical protein [Candidatus Saccharimonadales bacterium]
MTRTFVYRFVSLVGVFIPGWVQAGWQTIVSGESFQNAAAFTSAWNYAYPWGNDQNGSARMFVTNVVASNGMVTLSAWPVAVAGSEGVSSKNPHLEIHYNSGTFYLKQQITINAQFPNWDMSVQARVPSVIGTWPAVWFTGAHSWPPESDFMEFKGNSNCWQNTYNGKWQSVQTTVSSPDDWHSYRVVANLENTTNVAFHYYIDGILKTEQTSTTFVDSPCWLIVDFQMEGSSGAPGPTAPQFFYVSNLVVRREESPTH